MHGCRRSAQLAPIAARGTLLTTPLSALGVSARCVQAQVANQWNQMEHVGRMADHKPSNRPLNQPGEKERQHLRFEAQPAAWMGGRQAGHLRHMPGIASVGRSSASPRQRPA